MPANIYIEPKFRGKLINPRNKPYRDVTEPRIGVMLHFDASSSDKSGVDWFLHPDCTVGYNWYILDDGSYYEIVPFDKAAYHAGACKPSNSALRYNSANAAFIGIAIAAKDGEQATIAQVHTAAFLTRVAFHRLKFNPEETWRITGHEDEAWTRGRRADPTGSNPKQPVLSKQAIRDLVRTMKLVV